MDFVLPPDHDPWIPVARRILEDTDPILDASSIKAMCIGLRSIQHPEAKAAFAKLANLRPAAWRREDLAAGQLLPRKRRKQADSLTIDSNSECEATLNLEPASDTQRDGESPGEHILQDGELESEESLPQ